MPSARRFSWDGITSLFFKCSFQVRTYPIYTTLIRSECTLKKQKKLPWLLLRFSGEGAFFWKVVEHIPIPSGPNGIIFHQAARFPWIFLEFSLTIRYQPWWLEFGHVFRRWFHPRSPEAKSWESRSSNMIKAGATRVTLKFRAPAVFGGLGIGHQITTCWVKIFKKKIQCVNMHGLFMILLVEEIIHAPNHRIHRVFHYEVLYIRGVCGCVFSSICIYCVCTN